jgi:hypothetical protein
MPVSCTSCLRDFLKVSSLASVPSSVSSVSCLSSNDPVVFSLLTS